MKKTLCHYCKHVKTQFGPDEGGGLYREHLCGRGFEYARIVAHCGEFKPKWWASILMVVCGRK